MNRIQRQQLARQRRTVRVRARVRGTAEKPRVHVFRSNRFCSVQVIDDATGKTLCSITPAQLNKADQAGTKTEIATRMGSLIAEKMQAAKISTAIFDRGPYTYHGRVRAVAEAIRQAGITI